MDVCATHGVTTARAVNLLHSVTVVLVCGPLPRLRGLEAIAQKILVMVILVRGRRPLAHSIKTRTAATEGLSIKGVMNAACDEERKWATGGIRYLKNERVERYFKSG